MKLKKSFKKERDRLLALEPGTIIDPFEDLEKALSNPHPSEKFIRIFNKRVLKGLNEVSVDDIINGDHEDYRAWNFAFWDDIDEDDEDTVRTLEIFAWDNYYRSLEDGWGYYLDLIQTEYPEYKPYQEHLAKALHAMDYNEHEDGKIEFKESEEGVEVTITVCLKLMLEKD